MGMTGAKSALEVKDGLTFLDIIAMQVLALREEWDVDLPLVLMNSFRTSEESLEILAKYPTLPVDGLPLDFIQSAEPKLLADDLRPAEWPQDPELEWCPPGHGDVYVSLVTSGILDSLLEKGIRYAFLSNSDNLGATCDPDVAAWMVEHGLPYVAEVCTRTKSDRKGGHLAVRKSDGRLILRDTAMVEDGEERFFRDIKRHSTFNANNLWINLWSCATAWRRGTGCSDCPSSSTARTSTRPTPPHLRSSRSSRPWVRRSRSSRGRRRCSCRAPASARSRRRTTCSSCAPTTSSSTRATTSSPSGSGRSPRRPGLRLPLRRRASSSASRTECPR